MSRAGTIDGRQFALDHGAIAGTLGIGDLPRLAEMGCGSASLRYALRGAKRPDGRLTCTVEIAGRVEFTCQRCLRPAELPVALASELELAATQAAIDQAQDDVDRILATKAMDVAEIVEDETMLALPMVPMHERCENSSLQGETATVSPFAALARLRRDRSGPAGRAD